MHTRRSTIRRLYAPTRFADLEVLEPRRLLAVDLVADINPGAESSAPRHLTKLGDNLVYAASSFDIGEELWLTSSETSETRLLKDIRVGAESSHPRWLTSVGDQLFFFADGGTHGEELWKTDGTTDGTLRVKEIGAGTTSASVATVAASGGSFFFVTQQPESKTLWHSDGTDAGTQVIRRFESGVVLTEVIAASDLLYFTVQDEAGHTLWRTDGTQEGTISLQEPTAKRHEMLTVSDNADSLFFVNDHAIWQTNGTREGTTVVVPKLAQHIVIKVVSIPGGIAYQNCSDVCRWNTLDDSGAVEMTRPLASIVRTPSEQFSLIDDRSEYFTENRDWTASDGMNFITGQRQRAARLTGWGSGRLQPLGWRDEGIAGIWQTDLTVTNTTLIQQVRDVSDLGEIVAVNGTLFVAVQLRAAVGRELYKFQANLAPQTVQFESDAVQITESGDVIGAEITLTRSDSVGSFTVAIRPEFASDQDDVIGYVRDQVQFEDGELSKTIRIAAWSAAKEEEINRREFLYSEPSSWELTREDGAFITLRDDTLYELPEVVRLRLWNYGTYLTPTGVVEAELTIVDDDPRAIVLESTETGTKVVATGAIDTVAVSLNFRPTERVVVVPQFDSELFQVSPPSLEFSATDWNSPKLFQLQGLAASDNATLTVAVEESQSDVIAHGIADTAFVFSIDPPLAFEQIQPGLGVTNISKNTAGLTPRNLTVVGDQLYFTGDDGSHGRRLWRTDGTSAGTERIVGGPMDGLQESTVTVEFDDTLFLVTPASNGYELWKFAPSTNMLELVKQWSSTARIYDPVLVVADGKLFIGAGLDLWLSDGSTGNTQRIDSFPNPIERFFPSGDIVYVSASQFWVTDGTPAGAHQLGHIAPDEAMDVAGTLYFSAWGDGDELWRSDGTQEGTFQVLDIEPNQKSSDPRNLSNIDGTFYFESVGRQTSGIWKSDGTAAGTEQVSTLRGPVFRFRDELLVVDRTVRRLDDGTSLAPILSWLTTSAVIGDEAFYFLSRTRDEGSELWKSDGTVAGTTLLADIYPGAMSSQASELIEFRGELYFVAQDGISGTELWKSDGTNEGTQIVFDYQRSDNANVNQLHKVGDTVVFGADDGVTPGTQLWGIGPDATHVRLLNSLPEPSKRLDDPAYPGSRNRELINFVPSKSDPSELIFTHQFDYYWATANRQTEFELWRTDGTAIGTQLLKSSYFSFEYERYDDLVGPQFVGFDDEGTMYIGVGGARVHGFESGALSYDGTTASELEIPELSSASQFHQVGDHFVFSAIATPDWRKRELWVTSDGLGTTQRLVDSVDGAPVSVLLLAGVRDSNFSEFVLKDEELFFAANVEYRGEFPFDAVGVATQLWKTDGTAAGTTVVGDPKTGHVSNLTVLGDKVFFTTDKPFRLYVANGTDNAELLERFTSIGADRVVLNGALYFAADDGRGTELWRSDGTTQGTYRVADIAAGNASSSPSDFVAANDKLFFSATDGIAGREIWVSDGTADGTHLFADVFPGERSSAPTDLLLDDSLLYFVAADELRSRELWQLDLSIFGREVPGDVDGDQQVTFTDFLLLSAHFGQQSTNGPRDGDFDRDGDVDFQDFLVLSHSFQSQQQAKLIEHVFGG